MNKGKIGKFFHIISVDKADRTQIRKCSAFNNIDEIINNFKASPEWESEGGFEKVAAMKFKCVAIVSIDPLQIVRIIYGSIPPHLIRFLENIDRLEIGEFCIYSDIHNLDLVGDYVAAFSEKYRIRGEFQTTIDLAVTEAVTNAILHGNEGDANKKVIISLGIEDNIVTAIIKDEGEGFDFTVSYNDPTKPDTITKENGRGLYLMKYLSDELILEDNGSKVIMKFNLKLLQNRIAGKNNP